MKNITIAISLGILIISGCSDLSKNEACNATKNFKTIYGNTVSGECSNLTVEGNKAYICVGTDYVILNKTDKGWKAVDRSLSGGPCR